MKNRRGRGYFYVRIVGCLAGGSLLACTFLLSGGAAAGARSSSGLRSAENYDLAYPSGPTNSSSPTISGSAIVGGRLTAGPGGWTNGPTFGYQWADCNSSGADCTAIAGANGPTYIVTSSDLGHTIRVLITATNSTGHASAVSAATNAVLASVGEITAVLDKSLTPSGNGSSINTILNNGGYVATFTAPEGGTVTITWYEVPAGATVASAHASHKPVVVATGKRSFATAGTGTLKIKLTKTGKKLLKHSKKLKLTAVGKFTPKGAKSTTVKKKFSVKKH